MARNFEERAVAIFAVGNDAISTRVRALTAEHAAKGLLQSGATAKKAVAIFEEETGQALQQVLREAAKLIEHRGGTWRDSLGGIGVSLDVQIAEAPTILAKPLKMAGATGGNDAAKAVDRLLAAVGKRLRRQLAEFRGGWTAPEPKAWRERHPYLDRLAFLVIGAAITAAVGVAVGFIQTADNGSTSPLPTPLSGAPSPNP